MKIIIETDGRNMQVDFEIEDGQENIMAYLLQEMVSPVNSHVFGLFVRALDECSHEKIKQAYKDAIKKQSPIVAPETII